MSVWAKAWCVAKDRPNFIANRIGTLWRAGHDARRCSTMAIRFEEVDKITGPAAGRPKTATFRTFDLVGLDVFAHVVKNLHENLPDDPEREMFVMPEFVTKMIERGLLGNKTKAGFYQRKKGEGGQARDLDAGRCNARLPAGAKSEAAVARHGEEYRGHARAPARRWSGRRIASARFLWKTLSRTLCYTAGAHSGNRRHRCRSRSRNALGLQLGSWDRSRSGMQSASRNLSRN